MDGVICTACAKRPDCTHVVKAYVVVVCPDYERGGVCENDV